MTTKVLENHTLYNLPYLMLYNLQNIATILAFAIPKIKMGTLENRTYPKNQHLFKTNSQILYPVSGV